MTMKSVLLVLLFCGGANALFYTIANALNPGSWFRTVVNYPPYGEFDDEPPFDNAWCKVPNPPEEMGLELYLYTRTNEDTPDVLDYHGVTSELDSSHFDKNKESKFIIHGFTDKYSSHWVYDIQHELLKNGDYNVFRVNWQKGADDAYSQCAANTRIVAAMLAEFIKFLHTDYSKVHLIGHSLGAQISGQVGSRLNGDLGRITGLDPAGPYFDRDAIEIRLDSTDAQFVDVIHTDGEHLAKLGFGMERRMGDCDFYPEGGHDQTSCPETLFQTLTELFGGLSHARDQVACSHSRATRFFAKSINDCDYLSEQCSTYTSYLWGYCPCSWYNPCNQMGFHADKNVKGKFYVDAYGPEGSHPFCAVPYYKRRK